MHDPSQVKSVLDQILSSPEFSRSSTPFLMRMLAWLNKLPWLRKIVDKLGSLFQHTAFQLPKDTSLVFWVAALLVLTVLVYFVARQVRGKKAKPAAHTEAPEVKGQEPEEPDELETQALRTARGGDFRKAAELLFHASLLVLDRRGAILYRPHKTHREYEEELAGGTEARLLDHFKEMNFTYELKCFGLRPFRPEEFDDFLAQYRVCKQTP